MPSIRQIYGLTASLEADLPRFIDGAYVWIAPQA
jgi:hypothetical protein